jgi:hypothetical protein
MESSKIRSRQDPELSEFVLAMRNTDTSVRYAAGSSDDQLTKSPS